jgi:hypothetical protein
MSYLCDNASASPWCSAISDHSPVVSNVSYLPFGPVSRYTLGKRPNGQTVTRTYNANYQFTDISSPAFTLHVSRDSMAESWRSAIAKGRIQRRKPTPTIHWSG